MPNDSGNYSCSPSNAEPAHIAVHIHSTGNPAASIQHGKRSARYRNHSFQFLTCISSLFVYSGYIVHSGLSNSVILIHVCRVVSNSDGVMRAYEDMKI